LAPQPEVQSAIYTFGGSEKKSIYNWKFPTTILKGFQCTLQKFILIMQTWWHMIVAYKSVNTQEQ